VDVCAFSVQKASYVLIWLGQFGWFFMRDAQRYVQGPAVRSRRWLSNRSIDFLLLVGGVSLLAVLIHPVLKPGVVGLIIF
jgi:hypothetical protein